MDRDKRWERVERAYDCLTQGIGIKEENSAIAIENSYKNEVVDEFVVPCVIDGAEAIEENSSVIFFNFRPDRAREITRVFVDEAFDGFEREF